MTILVTGGAGFIGSHLCEHFLSNDHRVISLDNFDDFYNPAIKEQNINGLLKNETYELVRGDIRDAVVLKDIFANLTLNF